MNTELFQSPLNEYRIDELFKPSTPQQTKRLIYNGVDCIATLKIHNELQRIMNEAGNEPMKITYQRTIDAVAPAFVMRRRGIKVDEVKRKEIVNYYVEEIDKLEAKFHIVTEYLVGKKINANSPKQVIEFFQAIGVPPVMKFNTKTKKKAPTSDMNALLKFAKHSDIAALCVLFVRHIKDDYKLIGSIRERFPNDTSHAEFKPYGTETGRWTVSAKKGIGVNVQTTTNQIREIFIPRNGMLFAYPDLEQAESRSVGLLCKENLGADKYFEDCKFKDIHSAVCRSLWGKHLTDEEVKKPNYIRHFSMRDIAKRLGHATNYGGGAAELAVRTGVPADIVAQFQKEYFATYPEIIEWQDWTKKEFQTKRYLITPLQRKRYFFKEIHSVHAANSAIAFAPQSLVADILNIAMQNLLLIPDLYLLAQVHDAVLIELPKEKKTMLSEKIKTAMEIDVKGMVIPTEVVFSDRWKFK